MDITMSNKDITVQHEAKRENKQFRLLLLYAVGIGASGFAGLINLFEWYCMAAFHERWKHPYFYPFTLIGGVACFGIFLTFIALWFVTLNKRENKLKNIGISLICVIPGCILGYFAYQGTVLFAEWIKVLMQL